MEENEITEENEFPTTKSVAKKWGIISGLTAVVFFLIIDLAGLAGNQSVSWLWYLVFIVLVVMGHKEFKSEGDGYMSYGQGLGIGTLTGVFSALISNIFFFIYVSFISSGFIEVIKEKQIMDMQDRGMSDAEIEQAMGFSEFFMTPVAMSIMGFVFTVFFCFLVSLIVSIFTKNQAPELA